MTNADKYLKEEVDKEQFYLELATYSSARCIAYDKLHNCKVYENFFETEVKILTEDERVILKNIKTHCNKIGRDENSILYLHNCNTVYKDRAISGYYNHLFQFIKNGEEYSIEELLK